MTEASPPAATQHPLALIETSDPYDTVYDCLPLLDAGYDVVLCAGPRPDQPCPALDGQRCPLVESVDLVINVVRDVATQAAIARGVRELTPGTPMVVATSATQLRGLERRHLPRSSPSTRRDHARPLLPSSRRPS